ncbi:MAG: hypothetical protein JSR85_06120 [Proteobacteria bacterium]|nr:hypothetical protein [Pseudomonadota bacterium]
MGISIFLAQVLGLYLLIVGFGLAVNGRRIRVLMNKLIDNSPLLFVSGFIALIVGILLVVSHNIWVMDWRVIITLVGWAALIKGTMLVVFPEALINVSQKWVQCNFAYYSTAIFVFLLGGFLSYHGYM